MTLHRVSRLNRPGWVIILIITSLLNTHAAQPSTPHSYQQLDAFWKVFRQAVLAGDNATLLQLAQFPFATRGTMDDDPVIYLDRLRLEKNIDTILAQDPGLSPTGKAETMRDLFKRTPTIQDQGGGFAHVGDMIFQTVNGRWMWVRAYINEDELIH